MARQLGLARSYICDVIKGRRGVSVQLALRLEAFFAVDAEFWLRLQMNHDLATARAIEKRQAKGNAKHG